MGLLFAGCSGQRQHVAYANLGVWDTAVRSLGPVEACQGGFCCPEGNCEWPLSLTVPPPEETYYRALVDDAVKRYHVPANEVVLDRVTVELITEIVGTVRGWSAKATAGHKPAATDGNGPSSAPTSAEERLRQLESLHTKGLLTDQEFQQKRATILDGL
jgi:hypothetical protein